MKLYRSWRDRNDGFKWLKRLLWLNDISISDVGGANGLFGTGFSGSDGWPFTFDAAM